jgi:hypothetical protein
MFSRSSSWLGVLAGFVVGMANPALTPDAQGGDKKGGGEIPAVKKVDSQNDAIEQARKVDLPLLEKADKVVIARPMRGGQGRQVTLTRAAAIKELRQALKPAQRDPSAGKTAATITFYRGKRVLRTVWVFEGGEWGFERPGTSWTTGKQAGLWKAVQKHLK